MITPRAELKSVTACGKNDFACCFFRWLLAGGAGVDDFREFGLFLGDKAFKSVKDVPGEVDVAVFAIPAKRVSKKKPVVVLTGNDKIYEDVLRQSGVVRAGGLWRRGWKCCSALPFRGVAWRARVR